MARSANFKVIIAYEAFEKFTAVIRPQEMTQWERASGSGKIVNVIGHPEFHGKGQVNDQPFDKVTELLEIEKTPIALPQNNHLLAKSKDDT